MEDDARLSKNTQLAVQLEVDGVVVVDVTHCIDWRRRIGKIDVALVVLGGKGVRWYKKAS